MKKVIENQTWRWTGTQKKTENGTHQKGYKKIGHWSGKGKNKSDVQCVPHDPLTMEDGLHVEAEVLDIIHGRPEDHQDGRSADRQDLVMGI